MNIVKAIAGNKMRLPPDSVAIVDNVRFLASQVALECIITDFLSGDSALIRYRSLEDFYKEWSIVRQNAVMWQMPPL